MKAERLRAARAPISSYLYLEKKIIINMATGYNDKFKFKKKYIVPVNYVGFIIYIYNILLRI